MGAASLITLREGLEAALIVSIVMAHLRQIGRADQFGWVALGALAGVAVSLAAGVGVYVAIGELEGRAEQLTEGIIALVAVAVLTWMVFWMRRQGRAIGAAPPTQSEPAGRPADHPAALLPGHGRADHPCLRRPLRQGRVRAPGRRGVRLRPVAAMG